MSEGAVNFGDEFPAWAGKTLYGQKVHATVEIFAGWDYTWATSMLCNSDASHDSDFELRVFRDRLFSDVSVEVRCGHCNRIYEREYCTDA